MIFPFYAVKAESVWGSHLIQTTSYEDEYKGALHLGLLEITAMKEGDITTVKDKVSPCIVRIHCGGYVGSGIIISLLEENAVIVTNTHLMQYDVAGEVEFYQGFTAEGNLVAYSDQYDMAFLKVPLERIPMEEWECLRYVDTGFEYEQAASGDAVIQIGSVKEPAGDGYIGSILSTEQYIPEYGVEMLKTGCQAYTGMSGGGVFDQRGYLLGMITGGDMTEASRNEGTEVTYCIPLPAILQEYYSIIDCV